MDAMSEHAIDTDRKASYVTFDDDTSESCEDPKNGIVKRRIFGRLTSLPGLEIWQRCHCVGRAEVTEDMDRGDTGDDETPLMTHNREGGLDRQPTRYTSQRSCCHFLSRVLRPCLAEAVGVCLFVFMGSMSGLSNSAGIIAAAHGLTIMILIIAFGKLSGGHFNPCVTLGVSLAGGQSPLISLCYVIAQLAGSLMGAGLTLVILNDDKYTLINGGMPGLGVDVTIWQGIVCEMTLTFLLVLMVLMAAVDAKDNVLAPLAIGLSISVDIAAAGSISGAVMNPARAFGPTALWSSHVGAHAWKYHYIYWVGPIGGSLLAAMFYRFIFGSSQKRLICKD